MADLSVFYCTKIPLSLIKPFVFNINETWGRRTLLSSPALHHVSRMPQQRWFSTQTHRREKPCVFYCASSGQKGHRDKRKRNCRSSPSCTPGVDPLTSPNGNASLRTSNPPNKSNLPSQAREQEAARSFDQTTPLLQ